MLFSIGLLLVIIYLVYRVAPRERAQDAHVHGAGQVGLLAAIALFGVDYFTSFYYATGEMMSALHPYGLQKWGYLAVGVIALTNAIFGFLYMYSLGVFNEGGGSYTASMRYLSAGVSLVVAVLLIQDYIFTIVVSTLSGVDQALSLRGATGIPWIWHFLIGAVLVTVNWFLTIRGRGESGKVVFILLGTFVLLTIVLSLGLLRAHVIGVPANSIPEPIEPVTIGKALYHFLTASMKGLVALTGLEAMSNAIQFVKNEDAGIVAWGKKRLPRWKKIWEFYSGKSGIGRIVQTSFLFYGGITTLLLSTFSIRFNVFEGTFGRTLVGNLAFIGFSQIQGGTILFWAYQILAVMMLTAASMTAFQDLQATEWRDVAIGEIPEIVVYRDRRGTFTRSVTISYILTVIIMFILKGNTSAAIPYYGVGVFVPIMVMGFSIRKHILSTFTGRARKWGAFGATFAAVLSGFVFLGQIIGKWTEGGWVVLISFSILILFSNLLLISPIGVRTPQQIHRIVREKARVQGSMASIVEWQSLKMQEYRYAVLVTITRFFSLLGVNRPLRYTPPVAAGDYDHALHSDHPEAPSFLAQYLEKKEAPRLGGKPHETAPASDNPLP